MQTMFLTFSVTCLMPLSAAIIKLSENFPVSGSFRWVLKFYEFPDSES